jgi:hypothetical protein
MSFNFVKVTASEFSEVKTGLTSVAKAIKVNARHVPAIWDAFLKLQKVGRVLLSGYFDGKKDGDTFKAYITGITGKSGYVLYGVNDEPNSKGEVEPMGATVLSYLLMLMGSKVVLDSEDDTSRTLEVLESIAEAWNATEAVKVLIARYNAVAENWDDLKALYFDKYLATLAKTTDADEAEVGRV